MLWTEITNVVTRDGKTLAGTAVRDWLKERRVLPADYADASIAIVTDVGLDVILRTRAEVRAWLLDKQLCSTVDFAPLLVGDPLNRVGARGGAPINRNDLPMSVAFVRASAGTVSSNAALVQGETLRIGVRVTPAPRQSTKKLELSFIGTKIRAREAIRSVIGSTTGYRYLSRVRVARNVNGIEDPLSDLNSTFHERAYPRRGKGADHYRIEEFTLLGLEAGTELLQACMVNEDGTVECSAVLEIAVSLAPSGVGALRAFENRDVTQFKGADAEFDAIHALAPNSGASVKVGVCDSGTYDDNAGDNYLAGHWVAGKYFDSATGETADRDTKPDGTHPHHILDFVESPSLHGTNVAGQAVWGTAKIKLVDVMVQRGQETGKVTGVAAARAFTWARDQDVAVVNCSKVMPFRTTATNDVVSHARTTAQILFLATGGNSDFSFPLNTREPKAANNEVTAEYMPTCMVNTLWGGGCRMDRTPHESRGHGPAIEVMVPSNNPTVYSPREVRRAFRMQMLQKFRADMIAEMNARDVAIDAPPLTIAGTLSTVQRVRLADIRRRALLGALSVADQAKLTELEGLEANSPNPAYYEKDAYQRAAVLLASWALDPADNARMATSLIAWVDRFTGFLTDLSHDRAALLDTARAAGVLAVARDALVLFFREQSSKRNLTRHRDALAEIGPDSPNVAIEDGVSFGLPVVANIAAKLKLINDALTPNKLKRILIDTSDIDPGFETQCIARGIVNPLRAYLAAFDDEVSAGGRPHHDFAPVKSGLPENRRVYYTFFHMDSQGLDLYDAIKDRLQASYRDVNIDLVEAEPPVRIKSEPITYVTGRQIHGHSWTSVVPGNKVHPMVYAKKHLRLVLVNQTAHVEGGFNGEDQEFCVRLDTGSGQWAAVANGKVVIPLARSVTVGSGVGDVRFAVKANISDAPEHTKFTFAVNPQHIVSKLKVYGDGDVEIGEYDAPHALLRVTRTDDRNLTFHVIDQAVNDLIRTQGRKIGFQFGVVWRIGGNSQKCNIFVNNNYHAGSSGTPEAYSSALVLFQHEIGHSLGMVPSAGHAAYYHNKITSPLTGYGGDGDHCAHNTVNISNATAPNYGVIADGRSGEVKVPQMLTDPGGHADAAPCVMYHTRTRVHHRSLFCDECQRVLTGSTLEGRWEWSAE